MEDITHNLVVFAAHALMFTSFGLVISSIWHTIEEPGGARVFGIRVTGLGLLMLAGVAGAGAITIFHSLHR